MPTPLIDGILALQLLQVLFLGLHDWVPLGPFNDVKAVQAADPRARLIRVTVISTLPYAFGLAASIYHATAVPGGAFPSWLITWLWATYALLFLGQLRAWWLPYLVTHEPVRAARYRTMFGQTHKFLPERNGITPNTLHIALHCATLATLILLAFLP